MDFTSIIFGIDHPWHAAGLTLRTALVGRKNGWDDGGSDDEDVDEDDDGDDEEEEEEY